MAQNPRQTKQQIEEISNDPSLQKDLEVLPKNYNFEIPKTIWKIKSTGSQTVALQMPEGLLMFACVISEILTKYTGVDVIIMGDVTYGACCVDDTKGIHVLYVFVQIDINLSHLIDVIRENFSKEKSHLSFVSTIQFGSSLQAIKRTLQEEGYKITIPQNFPLSPGEVLGCTSPILPEEVTALIYVGDGRFHLESAMIQNPKVSAYKYDPYSREFTIEEYGFDLMLKNRKNAIDVAKNAQTFGLILGTLGRQGNPKILDYLEKELLKAGKDVIKVLLSEIFVDKLAKFEGIDCWVQVACPRLSIDWGTTFEKPILTPFELAAALGKTSLEEGKYPMDYYSFDSKGPWTNNHEHNRTIPRPKRTHISLKEK